MKSNLVHDDIAPLDITGSELLTKESVGSRIAEKVVLVRASGPLFVITKLSETVSPVKRYGLSANHVMERSAVGIYKIVVETVFDVLFADTGSNVLLVISAIFVSDHVIPVTRPVIVIEPVSPLARSPALNVNECPINDPTDECNHTNQAGIVSVMTVPLAISGHELP
jgi:hypothetical protein